MSHTNIAKFHNVPVNQAIGNEYLESNPPLHSSLCAPAHHLSYVAAQKLDNELHGHVISLLNEYVRMSDALPRLDATREQLEVVGGNASSDVLPSRLPCFIDSNNRHCAVAHLMKSTGARDLAMEIASKYKYAYVKDIARHEQDTALMHKITKWSASHNLSLEHLAMIQPTYEFMNRMHPNLDFSELSKQARQAKQPQNTTEHKNYRCKNCGQFPIRGVMYMCANCPTKDAYTLCESCERQKPKHDKDHVFLKVEKEMKVDGEGPLVDSKRMTSEERG